MVLVKYGTKDEPGFHLEESPDLIAVRTRSERPLRGLGPVETPPTAAVADGTLVAAFPTAGVEVYRVPTGSGTRGARAASLEARKAALRSDRDVRFAGSVLVNPDTNEPVLYTENLYIRFKPELDSDDCEQVIAEAGLTIKQRLDYATNAYFVEAPEGTGQKVFEIALALLARQDVVYCHPELIQERRHKQIFPQQWHLKATLVANVPVNAHANVEAAHLLTRGAGTTIAIIDDGIDIDHPEFAGPGKLVAPRDASQLTDDPRPKFADENHGTACAGVACANGVEGASGVAPQARLMPIRLADGLGSIKEANAFRWAADHGADVISCSWGPPDGRWFNPNDPLHNQSFPLPPSTRDAIDYVVTNGRNGKGCVVLFAAGNGNESVQLDGYASYSKVIAVAACNDRSKRSVYSDFGAAIWCAFPSSDMGHLPFNHPDPLTPGIWTADRLGSSGYNPGSTQFGDQAGKFTNDFGGTSSACPGAAGVAALVLSANRSLTWIEVRDILRRSCDAIDPQGGGYVNGHSPKYGYGRLNAERAVKLAKQSTGRLLIVNKLVNEPIPDRGTVEGTVEVAEATPVEKVAISVRLKHTYIGDLIVTVNPPGGSGMQSVVLHNRAGGSRDNLDMLYDPSNTPALAAYRGKKGSGKWTIRIQDKAPQDSGTLEQIGVQLFLAPAGAAPTRSVTTRRRTSVPLVVVSGNGRIKRSAKRKSAKR